MGKRSQSSQIKHDKEVEKQANLLLMKGYSVKADLPGFSKPNAISGRRPDIWATKNTRDKIIEVETLGTIESDRAQHSRFQNYADQDDDRAFSLMIA